jgi:hypothetical protein
VVLHRLRSGLGSGCQSSYHVHGAEHPAPGKLRELCTESRRYDVALQSQCSMAAHFPLTQARQSGVVTIFAITIIPHITVHLTSSTPGASPPASFSRPSFWRKVCMPEYDGCPRTLGTSCLLSILSSSGRLFKSAPRIKCCHYSGTHCYLDGSQDRRRQAVSDNAVSSALYL